MIHIDDGNATWLDVWGTLYCSTLSLIGSTCIIVSFVTVKRQSKQSSPRSARMILNLALSDFVWFLAAFIQACFWFFSGPVGEVGVPPPGVCWILGPLLNLCRISSLLWTSVIAFEALKSVTRRKWLTDKDKLLKYDIYYFSFVYGLALPSAIHLVYFQHRFNENAGCRAEYEHIGNEIAILLTEFLPIAFGFLLNIYSFYKVKRKMASRAFPKSVRNRRRRVMMYYLGVCVVCWAPTMVHYGYALIFGTSRVIEVLARCLLYLTGLFNFFVFGINDPHLYKSFGRFMNYISCAYCFSDIDMTSSAEPKQYKTVMFADADKSNADISKDKRAVYRYHRLSREDKISLYTERPDLDLKSKANNSYSPRPNKLPLQEPLLDQTSPKATKPAESALKKSPGNESKGNGDVLKGPTEEQSSDEAVQGGPSDSKEIIGLDKAILQCHDSQPTHGDVEEGSVSSRMTESSKSSTNSEEVSIFEPDESSSEEDEEESVHSVKDLAASLG